MVRRQSALKSAGQNAEEPGLELKAVRAWDKSHHIRPGDLIGKKIGRPSCGSQTAMTTVSRADRTLEQGPIRSAQVPYGEFEEQKCASPTGGGKPPAGAAWPTDKGQCADTRSSVETRSGSPPVGASVRSGQAGGPTGREDCAHSLRRCCTPMLGRRRRQGPRNWRQLQ